MLLFSRLVFFTFFFIINLEASSYKDNVSQYNKARKNYAVTIGKNNKYQEIKYLKKLVYYGNKLKKNTYKYKKELRRLGTKSILTTPKKVKILKSKYAIKSVTQNKNQITIIFNKNITKKDIRYFTKKSKRNFQYIFDINGRFKDAKPTVLSIDNIDRIKIVQYRFKTLRISFINKYRLKPIYIIGKKKITIKINSIKKRKKKMQYIPTFSRTTKQKIIVIDAGHGGKDVGAVGKHRRYEKNVTLNISKYLYNILNKSGYKVFLTRSKDKYIKLRNRTKFANQRDADMFISIHANASPKSKIKTSMGIETYFLSPARSSRSKRVAAKENKGDINSMGWSTKSTFLTILNQGKITASNKMAIDIQKNMLYSLRQKYGKKTIKDGGVREGPFWVLVGAQMPSVLIEVGYISHPVEGKRIYTSQYQKFISKAIANGINSYFLKNQ